MKLINSLQLTRHTLAMDSRDFWVYFQRFFLGASTFLIFFAAKNRVDSGSAGLYFFGMYFPLLAVAGTIGAINIFSGAVSKEKEDGILDLLILSGLRPLNFLLGRFFGKYVQMFKLLIMQIPFCLFGITLGGVTILQLLSSIFIIAAWYLFAGMVCFMISIMYSTRKEAMMVSYIVGTVLFCIFFPVGPIMGVLEQSSPEFRILPGTILCLLFTPFIFAGCCNLFDKNAVASVEFMKKKQEKDRHVKLTMQLTEKERKELKDRPTVRFEPGHTLRQKDEFLHPPAPIIPFVVLFVKNAGCGGLLIWCTWLFGSLLLMASPAAFTAAVILYLAYRSWHRLVLVMNSELEDNTLDSLKMIPDFSSLVKEKIKIASRYNIQILVMYIILIFSSAAVPVQTYTLIGILFIPLLKVLFDYIIFFTVLKVRNAPMAASMSLISTLLIFYFLAPLIAIPLYTFAAVYFKKLCEREVDSIVY